MLDIHRRPELEFSSSSYLLGGGLHSNWVGNSYPEYRYPIPRFLLQIILPSVLLGSLLNSSKNALSNYPYWLVNSLLPRTFKRSFKPDSPIRSNTTGTRVPGTIVLTRYRYSFVTEYRQVPVPCSSNSWRFLQFSHQPILKFDGSNHKGYQIGYQCMPTGTW